MNVRRTLTSGAVFALVVATPATAATTLGTEATVTDGAYVRHDGGTDDGLAECNDTSPTGGSRRQSNEPYAVVSPDHTDLVVAGTNDYCLSDLDAGWEGFHYSIDGGTSWTRSLVPGYPQDTSTEGQRSPIHGTRFAGDPIAAFDNDGHLFVGGIAFNRSGAIEGSVWVATYDVEPARTVSVDGSPVAYPFDYRRTRVVGKGTPSRDFWGIFQDKPLLEVDRTGGMHDGNVYVCWARFVGAGRNKIYFSRSTDAGATFSKPVALSEVNWVQGCDIAVEADGDVYVTWRTFEDAAAVDFDGLQFVRSSDGGASFSKPSTIRSITPYFPFDGSRDCGDGPFECPSEFVFHRVPLEPRVTADQAGTLPGVYLAYNEIRPGSTEPSATSYRSAGSGQVGQSLVYVIRSLDDGASWSSPTAVDPHPTGHQYFPDIDALDGQLGVVWQDNRNDPAYSVQLPLGNTAAATASGTEAVDTFVATSSDGTSFAPSQRASTASHQPQYEMFGDRNIPFQGDYNWMSLARDDQGDLVGYTVWTDNRNVVAGADPREAEQDGFDVHQCRALKPDGTYGPDTCPNEGGLNQDIVGRQLSLGP